MEEQSKNDRKQLNVAVHDLCQPLTTLQCRLELATLTCTPESYREAVEDGLAECRRMVEAGKSSARSCAASRRWSVSRRSNGDDDIAVNV